jgi:predicted site-specific integrase-resolvase
MLLKGVDTLSKYYSIHEFSKIIGVSAQTLRNWDANGKLHPHHTTVSGYRYYSDEQLNQVINVKPKKRITIGYCRVSSNKQKDDLERQIDKVVVLYKDRLLRFGFELIEYIASLYNCEIEIIDNTEKSEQQELVEDLVQIITVFSCKLQGKRANKAKKLIRELIQEETDGKSHKSNVDTKQRTGN